MAQANGLLASGNSTDISEFEVLAVERGCYMYKGLEGKDIPGTWRLPTNRELMLIYVLKESLYATQNKTRFENFTKVNPLSYWSRSEERRGGKEMIA